MWFQLFQYNTNNFQTVKCDSQSYETGEQSKLSYSINVLRPNA